MISKECIFNRSAIKIGLLEYFINKSQLTEIRYYFKVVSRDVLFKKNL